MMIEMERSINERKRFNSEKVPSSFCFPYFFFFDFVFGVALGELLQVVEDLTKVVDEWRLKKKKNLEAVED